MLLNKQTLHEVNFVEQQHLSKSVTIDKDGIMTIKGIILSKSDEKNKNNRVYPKTVLEKEVNKLSPKVTSRMLRGELDHPEERLAVLLKESSHLITNAYWDSEHPNWLRGDLEILKNPLGSLIETYVKQRSPVGISSRGEGSLLYKEDYYEVQDDFELVTWDIVSDQSTFGAIINEAIKSGKINLNKNTDPLMEAYNRDFEENQQILYSQIKKSLR